MPKGFGSSHVGNTGKGSGKGHAGNTGGKGQGAGSKTGGPPQAPKGSKGAGKHGQNKHVKGSAGWQAAHDAYARVIGQPAAAGEPAAAGAKAQQLWACRGPGGCQHDKNPGGPSGTKVCLNCGLPWEYGARPAFWAGLATRQAAKAAAGNGNGTPGKGARRPPPGGAGAPGGPAGGGGPAAGVPPPAGAGAPPARPPGPLATEEGLAALVGLLGEENPAVTEYKVRLQQQAPPTPPPAESAGTGRTQEGLAQLKKLLGHEHEACQTYAEELRKEKDELLLPEQRVAGKVRYSAILENRRVKAQARVAKANAALASAQAEADAAAERLAAVEGQITTVTDEIQALMSAAPEDSEDAVMATGGGEAPPLSAQALVEALQAKVRDDLGAGTDEALKSVLAPVLDLLMQAQAAIAQLPRRPGPAPVGPGISQTGPVPEAAGVPAAGQASGQPVEGGAGSVVAGLRGNFEPVEHGKHMQKVGPY